MGTIAGSWGQAQEFYGQDCQLSILMANGVSLGKLAAGTVTRFHEVYPDR